MQSEVGQLLRSCLIFILKIFWSTLYYLIHLISLGRRELAFHLVDKLCPSFFCIDDGQVGLTREKKDQEALNPISHGGGGKFAPPPVYPGKAQNWLGPEGQAFAAFILI